MLYFILIYIDNNKNLEIYTMNNAKFCLKIFVLSMLFLAVCCGFYDYKQKYSNKTNDYNKQKNIYVIKYVFISLEVLLIEFCFQMESFIDTKIMTC